MAKGVKQHNMGLLDITDIKITESYIRLGRMALVAKEHNVSQPLCSYRIGLVETLFRQRVKYRRQKGDDITHFGKMLYPYLVEVIQAYDKLDVVLTEYQTNLKILDGKAEV
jgi:DNA-binding transcriptional LysR family regulator